MTIRERIAEAKYEYEMHKDTNRDAMTLDEIRELEFETEVARKKLERFQLQCMCKRN